MSVQEGIDFFDRLSRDEEFLATIIAAEDREARLAIVRRAGYNFDQVELEEAAARFFGDCDDERLNEVARAGMSLLDVVMARVGGHYGDVCFFEDMGPLRLS